MTPASPSVDERAPLNKTAAIMFGATTLAAFTIIPWYAWTHQFSLAAWIFFAVITCVTGISITGGYHRLWSHRAYEAHWSIRLLFMLFGGMALQNSVLIWSSTHRVHHREIDDVDHDPYAIGRGFWFAHMGWMIRDYPSSAIDLSNVQDLQRDPIVAFQHRHYVAVATFMNVVFPLALGALFGDAWGFFLLGGLLRLVLNHHSTFFINSLAHMWGSRPYTGENSARDNDFIAMLTWGEGYHNYHHLFQWDYRNGVRWWQFDPTKWIIAGLSTLGLTRNLRRVPEFKIQRAMLQRQFERAHAELGLCTNPTRIALIQRQLEHELEVFTQTLNEWTHLQTERIEAARRQLVDQWEHSETRRRFNVLEDTLRSQRRRVRQLRLQTV